jgi:hypothetical protein
MQNMILVILNYEHAEYDTSYTELCLVYLSYYFILCSIASLLLRRYIQYYWLFDLLLYLNVKIQDG